VILINEGRKRVDRTLEDLQSEGLGLDDLFAREAARDVATPVAATAEEGAR
jgi:hypothetical protein